MVLVEGLELLKPRITLESLAAYNNFKFDELQRFRQIYQFEVENITTGAEPFFGEMLTLKKINVSLLNNVYNILIAYYNNAYDMEFLSIADSVNTRSS
ncbi:10199_t:CDS:1, partial [Funneliformis mosseae]